MKKFHIVVGDHMFGRNQAHKYVWITVIKWESTTGWQTCRVAKMQYQVHMLLQQLQYGKMGVWFRCGPGID